MDDTLQKLRDELILFAPRLATALLLLVAFAIAARIVARIVDRVGSRAVGAPEIVELLARTAQIAIIAFGVVSSLGTLGVNVMGLVAGLGLAGFAAGFALKDALSNALSGVLILMYRPFRHGDRVSVTGFEGMVAFIDLRYTTLALDDGRRALVPNSAIFSNPITVASRPAGEADAVARPARTISSATR
jgi:small conductance mechanosensitive channel